MLTIRRAQSGDLPAIEACVLAAYAPWIPIIGMKPGPMLEDYAEVLRTRVVFVAERGATVVGVLVLSITDADFWLENIAVHPSAAGQGYGQTVLKHAEHEAVARGHTSIRLYTHEKMARNIALYEKTGYIAYDRRTEGAYTRVFMRKDLAPR